MTIDIDRILAEASEKIEHNYFQLPVARVPPAAASAVYRERVYCYELYHHMRTKWPEGSPLVVSGEADKTGHDIIERGMIPDFIIHTPGSMGNNYCAIEVKINGAKKSGIKKDLENLGVLMKKYNYSRAIYLIYGPKSEKDIKRIKKIAKEIENEDCNTRDIELWIHKSIGERARIVEKVGTE